MEKTQGVLKNFRSSSWKNSLKIVSVDYLYLLAFLPITTCLCFLLFDKIENLHVSISVGVYALSVSLVLYNLLKPNMMLLFPGLFFFVAGNMFWFAYPALMQIVTPGLWFGDWINRNVSTDALMLATLGVSLFFMSGLVTFSFFINQQNIRRNMSVVRYERTQRFDIPERFRVKVLAFGFAIGVSPYLIFGGNLRRVVDGIMGARSSKAWSLSPEDSLAYASGVKQMFFWITGSFLVAVLSLSALYLFIDKRNIKRRIYYLCFAVVAFLIIYFDRGTRSLFIVSLLPAIYLGMLLNYNKIFDRKKIIFSGILLSILLIAMTQFQMYYRLDRTRGNMGDISIDNFISLKEQNDFFTETAIAIDVRERIGFDLHEIPLVFFAANVVPRSLWPNKPMPQTLWYYSLDRRNADIWKQGGNALPSVVGQYYMNWGWLGVVWGGMLFGLLSFCFNMILWKYFYRIESVLVGTMGAAFLFASFRFFGPGFHYPVLALVVMIYASKYIKTIWP